MDLELIRAGIVLGVALCASFHTDAYSVWLYFSNVAYTSSNFIHVAVFFPPLPFLGSSVSVIMYIYFDYCVFYCKVALSVSVIFCSTESCIFYRKVAY